MIYPAVDVDADICYVNSMFVFNVNVFTEIPDIRLDSARYNRAVIDYAFRLRPSVQLIQYRYRVLSIVIPLTKLT